MKIAHVRTFGFLVALVCCNAVLADEYHYNNMLIGDRASGLAGAYTAVSDDPAGMFYNPAGIAYAASSNLSASMNTFHLTRTEYKQVLGGADWVRTSSSLLPNFFGVIQPLGRGILGFSYAVTDSILEDQSQLIRDVPSAGTEYVINFNNQDVTYNIGPSYAIKFDNNFSLGITLYAYARQQEQIFNQSFDFPNPSTTDIFHWENSYYTVGEYGVKPILGVMFSPMEKVSMGVSASYTALVYAKRKLDLTCATTYSGGATASGVCQLDELNKLSVVDNYRRSMPWKLSIGSAYFASEKLLVSYAADIYQALYGLSRPTVNHALGLEYYFTGTWALRMGAYTDFANTPKLSQNVTNQREHVDNYGGSMSISHFTRSSAITVGVTAGYGTGQAQVISDSIGIQKVRAYTAAGYMSASYSY